MNNHTIAPGLATLPAAMLLLLTGLLASTSATAGLFEVDGALVGFGYSDTGGPGATPPNSPLEASFTFRYDDGTLSGSGSESLPNLSLNAFNTTIDGLTYDANDVLATAFFNNGTLTGYQIFAGLPGIVAGTNDVFIAFSSLSTVTSFTYASVNFAGSVFAANTFEGDSTLTALPPTIPLPATLWLMLAGAAGVLRLRKRQLA